MVVETLFWFHPLVWWIGTRLVEERERACDESVLCAGGDPEIYAMGILLTCRFYLESPMRCMAGVTGGNLKRRVELIMTQAVGRKLTAGRKALLAGAAMATIVTPAVIGFLNAPVSYAQPQAGGTGPGYEVASIKPSTPGVTGRSINADDSGRLTTENTTLKDLMRAAYGVRDFQIVGGPAWFDKDTYDIVAKPAGKSGPRDFGPNIQKLLADRFQLHIHRETKETSVYDLIIAKGGPKLKEVSSDPRRGIRSRPGVVTGMGASMVNLARYLSQLLGSQVNDKTGLSGEYDFQIEYAPDEGPVNKGLGDGPPTGTADSARGPSIFTAVQEQLGLRLTAAKGRVEVIVIDHAEKPSEN
jgi:uncharacterized protein (TIGR03435 family)